MAGERVQTLDSGGHSTGGDAGQFFDMLDAVAIRNVCLVGT
jgi:hypothetical protein